MSPSLPYAADAESPLKPEELQVLRAQYEKEGDYVGIQTKFNYAWGLIKSTQRPEQQEGVRLLSEIFRNSPERRRECLYYLALGNYKLGNYAEARRYNDLLLDLEPANLQAGSLKSLIDDRVAKEGLMGCIYWRCAGGYRSDNVCKSRAQPLTTTHHRPSETNPLPPMDQQQGARDMVFCHECQNEWYRDEHGLACPSCHSEFTEIIEADHDPRDDHIARDSLEDDDDDLIAHNPWAVPDPEEQAPRPHDFGNGFSLRRSGPNSYSITGTWTTAIDGRRVAGGDEGTVQDPLLRNFVSMMENITGGTFRAPNAHQGGQQADGSHRDRSASPEENRTRGGPRLTYTSSAQLFPRDANNPGPHVVPFDNLHQVIASLLTAPTFDSGNGGDYGRPAPAFTRLFARLLGHAPGDFVDEEDFDRIMSQLMEQHVSGDAPGPASEATIAALPKKSLTRDMVGGKDLPDDFPDSELKGECSICIEGVQIGEEVAVLPCGHWFHHSCISAWLREHDTCPHCRKGVEKKEGTGNGGECGPNGGEGSSSSGSGSGPSAGGSPNSGGNTRSGTSSNIPQHGPYDNSGLHMPGGFDTATFGNNRHHSNFAPLRTHHTFFSAGHVHPMDLFEFQRTLHHEPFPDAMHMPFAYETHAVYATGQPHLLGFSSIPHAASTSGQRRRRSSLSQMARLVGHSFAPGSGPDNLQRAERQSVGDRLRSFFR
ncbi:hypothetical protein IWX91DRAFT_285841 [Phyllosticta citricarpa]